MGITIEQQASIDRIRDKLDILESDYEESGDETIKAMIDELYDLLNSRG
jgi:hypothetical protein